MSNVEGARFGGTDVGLRWPLVLKLEQRTGELLAPPTIDAMGNTLVQRAAVGAPITTERRTSLLGSASTLGALDAIL
ncbi:MAG: hypothetical protein JNK04_12305 [Myxococcales bacterium]|nr:hypothetical protein [Myxococcales bacterium]